MSRLSVSVSCMSPDGEVGRLAGVGETHLDQDGDWEDADQAGDHQVATDRLPAVLIRYLVLRID